MENQLSSIALGCVMSGLTYCEIKRFNNLITPFTVSALPIVLISLFTNFLFINMGIKSVSVRSNFFLMFCLIIIWLVGFLISKFFNQSNNKFSGKNLINIVEIESYKYFLIILALVISGITFWKIKNILSANGGLLFIGNDKFEKEMIVGPVAHLLVLGQVVFLLLYLIAVRTKKKYLSYPVLLILGLSIFLIMVKYHLLWLIMMIFFFNNLKKSKKIQFKRILKIGSFLSLTLVFYFIFLSFFWGTFSFTNSKLWEFFFKTFLNYFATGPINLDYWLSLPGVKPDWTMFIVPLNFSNVVMGNLHRIDVIQLVTTHFYTVGPGVYSNIGTSFGVYYLIGGLPFTILLTGIFAVLSYYFYLKGLKSGNFYFVFLALFFLTLNTLNFFGQYFTFLSFFEFPMFLLGLILFLKILNVIRSRF